MLQNTDFGGTFFWQPRNDHELYGFMRLVPFFPLHALAFVLDSTGWCGKMLQVHSVMVLEGGFLAKLRTLEMYPTMDSRQKQ